MQFVSFQLADFATGAAIPNGKCFVYLTGTATLAALFDAGGSSIANPAIASSLAQVGFAAADAIYDFQPAYPDGTNAGPKILKQQIFDLTQAARVLLEAPTIPQRYYQPTDPDFQAAIQRALDDLNSKATTGYGYGKGTSELFIPAGIYDVHDTFEVTYTNFIRGANRGGPSGAATMLRMTAAKTVFRGQSENTSGASGPSVVTAYPGGAMAEVCNLGITGNFVATESESHGFDMRVKMNIHDNFIDKMPGDGVFASVNATSGTRAGNANNGRVRDNFIRGCRKAIYANGVDANAIDFRTNDANSNRQWGYHFDNLIGVNVWGGDLSSNGQITGWPTMVSYSGNWYAVIAGQEAWCSTHSPSGTTAHNQGWYFIGAGGAVANRPAWVSGTTYRAGGPVLVTGNSNFNLIEALYTETDQGPSQIDNCGTQWLCPLATIPILNAGGVSDGTPYGGQLIGGSANMRAPRSMASGDIATRGQMTLTEAPDEVWRHRPRTGSGTTAHLFMVDRGGGFYTVEDSNGHQILRFNVANGRLGSTDTEVGYKFNGTQVLGAQQGSTPGAATDPATTMALANFIRAALLAHGAIA